MKKIIDQDITIIRKEISKAQAKEIFKDHLILFSVNIATRDHLYESVIGTIAMFKEKGLRVETHIARGAHNWINCRLYLINTMQQIFK